MDKKKCVLIKEDESEQEILFKDLKTGDKFTLFEPSGEAVECNKKIVLICSCDAYLNDQEVWTVMVVL